MPQHSCVTSELHLSIMHCCNQVVMSKPSGTILVRSHPYKGVHQSALLLMITASYCMMINQPSVVIIADTVDTYTVTVPWAVGRFRRLLHVCRPEFTTSLGCFQAPWLEQVYAGYGTCCPLVASTCDPTRVTGGKLIPLSFR